MPDLSDLRALIKDHEDKDPGLVVDVAMCMRTELADELADLEEQREEALRPLREQVEQLRQQYAGSLAEPDLPDPESDESITGLDEEIAAKRAEVEAATITLHFKALSKPGYRELRRKFPFNENSTEEEDEAFLGALTEKCYQGIKWQGSEFTRDQLPWTEVEERFVSGEVDPIYGEVLVVNRANKSRRPLSSRPLKRSPRT